MDIIIGIQNQGQLKLLAYPNPTNGRLSAEVQQFGQEGTWTLLDVQGKKIKEGKYADGRFEVDIQDLPGGMYFLRVQSGGNEATLKVIRE